MHTARPDIYKDDNHKPEFAVAISDDFLACFGFAKPDLLARNFLENPVLASVFHYNNEDTAITPEFVKQCVHKMFFELEVGGKEKLQEINNMMHHKIS